MENLYKIRAYRWNESKYELTCPYIIVSNSKDEARDSLAAFLGDGWKTSEAFKMERNDPSLENLIEMKRYTIWALPE
ncbi:MAG: hypothetical protein V1734_04010 [Nanoarchaeota archaeon]